MSASRTGASPMTDIAGEPDTGSFDFYGAHYARFGNDLAATLRREI